MVFTVGAMLRSQHSLRYRVMIFLGQRYWQPESIFFLAAREPTEPPHALRPLRPLQPSTYISPS